MRQPSVRARRVAAVSVSLVLAAGAAACGPKDNDAKGAGSGDSKPQKGGTLTVLNSKPQDDFDPARLYTSGGGNVPSLVFRTLTTRIDSTSWAG